jgi:6-phosphogluconolactonase
MPSQSIGVWHLEPESLQVRRVATVDGLFSPSFLCTHPKLRVLYAAERSWSEGDTRAGAVTAFAIAPKTGELRRLDRWPSGGAFTAHVSVSGDGRYLLTANPHGPSVALFRLGDRGVPEGLPCVVYHSGRGATPRQEKPWPHSGYFDSTGQRVLACDLGLDRVFLYDIDPQVAALRPGPQAFAQVCSGAGARHLALGVNNPCVYVANELDSTLCVFRWDPTRHHLGIVQTINSAPEEHLVGNQPAEIVVSPEGRHLFVTNRGHDSIAVFKIDPDTGRLRVVEYVPCGGSGPRHIGLDARGTLAAVCNQRSNEVVLFRIDRDGRFQGAGERISVPSPTCAVLVGDA